MARWRALHPLEFRSLKPVRYEQSPQRTTLGALSFTLCRFSQKLSLAGEGVPILEAGRGLNPRNVGTVHSGAGLLGQCAADVVKR